MKTFLSYGSADKKVAERLREELGKAGLAVWSDSDISAGDDWRQRMEEAIHSADQILVLVSPKNGEDPSQQLTWRAALETVWQDPRKRLIPILLRGAAPPPFIYSAATGGQRFVRLDDPHKVSNAVREIVGLIQGGRTRDFEAEPHPPEPPITQFMDPPSRGDRLSEIKEYAERLRSSS